MVKSLYEFIVNKVHDKVNKDDIYFIGIMKKFIRDLHDNYCFPQITAGPNECFGMFILTKEENDLFKKTKFSNAFLNHFKNKAGEKNCIIFEYTLNDKYTLYIYGSGKRKPEITKVMKANLGTLQLLFRDENLKVFQQKLIDIFGLYGSFTTLLMLFHYLNRNLFWFYDIFGKGSIKKNLGEYGEGNVTIDISILETIIKEGKEKFKEKLDLLYLLSSNINKKMINHYYFKLFFDFLEKGIERFQINEEDIKNQNTDGEFHTYSIKIHYLCSYIFREFFDDYVHGGSKQLISFYNREDDSPDRVFDGAITTEKYKNFDLEYLKKVTLLIDKILYKKFS